MSLLDWEQVEDRVYQESAALVSKFADDYPTEVCSFIAYDIPESPVGTFFLSFDSYSNSIKVAQEYAAKAEESRKTFLKNFEKWKTASSYTDRRHLTPYSPNTGDFKYPEYGLIDFPEWENLDMEKLLQRGEFDENDYLVGHIRILLWRVVTKLIESNILENLRKSSPFYLGYQLHDGNLIVLKILNWPEL